MKKLLSILLCLCLLAGGVMALIPTATAAVANPECFPTMDRAELIYSQNFEGNDVTGAASASALVNSLGWSGTAFQNMEIRQDGDSSNHQLYFKANSNSSMTICTDDRLAGGNYVIEYTATMLTFASDADGAGLGFRSSSYEAITTAAEGTGWNFLLKERGNFDFHFHTPGVIPGNHHSEVDIAPNAETVNGVNRANGSVVGEKIRFRLVINAENGLSAYTIDQSTGEATIVVGMNEEYVSSWAANSAGIGNAVQIRAIRDTTSYLVDDIQIWNNVKTKSVPDLLGYQTTSLHHDTYDVRFVAQVKGTAATSMGFKVDYSFLRDGSTITGSKNIYCKYLYESLSTDFGDATLTADSANGYNYLIALSINGIPSDAVATYRVTPFSLLEGNNTLTYGSSEAYEVSRTLLGLTPRLSGGTLASTKEFTTDHQRLYYTGTTLAEYNAYVNKLPAQGFELYQENTVNGNVYKTFTSDYLVLHAYYLASQQTTSILVTEKDNWTAYPTKPTEDPVLCENALTMMDMSYETQTNKNNGMGFVYSLEDGSYVIIDGGFGTEADALYNYLQKHNHRPDGEILIRAWIMTHPDGDHYGCFNQFTTNYANSVTLEYFVAQFDQYHITTSQPSVISTIYANVAKYDGCKNIVPMPGQVMYFGTLKIEFLFTAEMYQGYTGADLGSSQTNEASLVFKAYVDDTNVLFMADVVGLSIDAIVTYYGSALRCQYYQAPHHGLNGTTALYDAVLPEYVLMTTHSAATEQRLDKTHDHGKQSLLYYLMNKGCVKKVFSAGELDAVAGDEFTVIFGTVSVPVIPSPDVNNTIKPGNYETERDEYTFDQLFGNN